MLFYLLLLLPLAALLYFLLRPSPAAAKGTQVLIAGHSGSGKTALLYLLKHGHLPSLGTVSSLETNKTTLSLNESTPLQYLDIPGHLSMRPEFFSGVSAARAIVLLADATSVPSVQTCAELLYDLLTLKAYHGQPILIMANKQDLPHAKNALALEQTLRYEIDKIKASRKAIEQEDDDFEDYLRFQKQPINFDDHRVQFCQGSVTSLQTEEVVSVLRQAVL